MKKRKKRQPTPDKERLKKTATFWTKSKAAVGWLVEWLVQLILANLPF